MHFLDYVVDVFLFCIEKQFNVKKWGNEKT